MSQRPKSIFPDVMHKAVSDAVETLAFKREWQRHFIETDVADAVMAALEPFFESEESFSYELNEPYNEDEPVVGCVIRLVECGWRKP